MALHNFSLKLSKELFRLMGGLDLISSQKVSVKKEVSQAKNFLSTVEENFEKQVEQAFTHSKASIDDFKHAAKSLNFSSFDDNVNKLQEAIDDGQDRLQSLNKNEDFFSDVTYPAIDSVLFKSFWKDNNFELYPEYQLELQRLESSKVDFYAISSNKKSAYFVLMELNRDAPESNVLKLCYYLKNSKQFWSYENIHIIQVFSPKYLVERKGKSLALARQMSAFLGDEFSGNYAFGEQKLKLRYFSTVFAKEMYEIYSIFWKLMADAEQNEEARFEKLCNNLPRNPKFLQVCKKYVDRCKAKNLKINPSISNLVNESGTADDVKDILASWCLDIGTFIEKIVQKSV
ncbi:MAG: hypothetical protein KC646_00215 [Candidatus Cloacimonetes bacterium]|nr:hypothetical protein [Candidatus Cloacimonadota bacterium]